LTGFGINELQKYTTLLGVAPRSEVQQQMAMADLLILPSLCEGSATVCYEALAAGLPVITTENAGSVVRHGVDGFIVPIRNVDAIVECVEKLAKDRALREWMSANARERAAEYTADAFGRRLLEALHSRSHSLASCSANTGEIRA
jgi:glycosyltransferase involved in cell wall biosynthesis